MSIKDIQEAIRKAPVKEGFKNETNYTDWKFSVLAWALGNLETINFALRLAEALLANEEAFKNMKDVPPEFEKIFAEHWPEVLA